MGKTTRSPRKLLKKKHIVCSYQTPKSKLKSALKKSGKSRYASHHRVEEEEEENRNRLIFSPTDDDKQIQKTPLRNHVNFADEKTEKEEEEERVSEEEDAWNFDLTTTTEKKNSKKKNLVARPPPTPSTPFHFARDFFERGCESDAEELSLIHI